MFPPVFLLYIYSEIYIYNFQPEICFYSSDYISKSGIEFNTVQYHDRSRADVPPYSLFSPILHFTPLTIEKKETEKKTDVMVKINGGYLI